MLILLTDHLFTSSMGRYCLRYWICEIRILLLEWNHILFMRYVIWFKVLQNKMWFVSGSRYSIQESLSSAAAQPPHWLPPSVGFFFLRCHFFWDFQVAQQCPLMFLHQEKDRQGPSGAEGVLVGWLEYFDWLPLFMAPLNFLPSHFHGWISFLLGRHMCHVLY